MGRFLKYARLEDARTRPQSEVRKQDKCGGRARACAKLPISLWRGQRRAQKNWLGRDGLQRLFGAGSHLVVAGFKLIMTLAQLGLNLFGHQINGRVEIALCIPGN